MPKQKHTQRICNEIRTAILRLQLLDETECTALLTSLQHLNLADDKSVLEITGLTATAGSAWETLYIGELKTLLALAIGDKYATQQGCDWVHQFDEAEESRRRVYRCVDGLLNMHKTEMFHHTLELMHSTETLHLAMDLIKRRQRFFGLDELELAK